ncbi:MAG: DUF805 domain-containing protein [Gammaproteobacteria bacterium]
MVATLKRYAALNVAAVLAIPGLYVAALKKYIVFSGRAPRLEFCAFLVITLVIGYMLDQAAKVSGIADTIGLVFGWAMFLPFVSLTVRRLHDFGASGWWFIIVFSPFFFAPFVINFYPAVVADAEKAAHSWIYLVTFGTICGVAYIIFHLVLILKGGDKDDNKHGAPSKAAPQGA